MVDIGAEHVLEVAAAEDQQPVETLAAHAAHAADEAFGVGVRLRQAHRRADHADAFAAEDLVKDGGVLAVAVMDQKPRALEEAAERDVARLLRDPGAGWVRGSAGEMDTAALELDEEEHVEATQTERLDREEIAGDHARRLLSQERLPARARSSAPVPAALPPARAGPCSPTRGR